VIQNKQYRIPRAEVADTESLLKAIKTVVGQNALRWYVAQVTSEEIVIEATTVNGPPMLHFNSRADIKFFSGKSALLSIIPTGVGCRLGGYAGDAAPVTNLLASAVDYLITNPNAVNASNFIGLDSPNIVYTDGCSIDLFCQGLVDLHLPYGNRIGLIVEKSGRSQLDKVFNIVNAVRAVHGVNITDVLITEERIGGRCFENKSGAFVGTIDHPQVLLEACEKLIGRGVNAIACTSNIQDLPSDSYASHFDGQYPNPVGGVEAVISYLVTTRFGVPSAHAPLINIKELDLRSSIVDARGAGEMASTSGLACVLIGLHRAPQIRAEAKGRIADVITLKNILALVTPASCLGGTPAIQAQVYGIPIIAVRDNHTILNVTEANIELGNVIEVGSYAEAAGIVLALKRGLSLESITRPLHTLRYEALAEPFELSALQPQGEEEEQPAVEVV